MLGFHTEMCAWLVTETLVSKTALLLRNLMINSILQDFLKVILLLACFISVVLLEVNNFVF